MALLLSQGRVIKIDICRLYFYVFFYEVFELECDVEGLQACQ